MALRPIALSIPSTTQIKVTFSDELSSSLSAKNFVVKSLNGAVSDLEILSIDATENVVVVKTRPQVSGNYYLLKFVDTLEAPFSSRKGKSIPFDSASREIFFVGIDNVNPFRDRMYGLLPDLFEVENTTLKSIISSQAEEFHTAQKTIGEVLSNNYLSVDVNDEVRVRSSGATDRMANENAYEVVRVSKTKTNSAPIFEVIDYTASNPTPRSQSMSVYPVSMQQVVVEGEEIMLGSEGNGFNGFLLDLKMKNVIKLLSVRYIPNGSEPDCNGQLGVEYDVERYKYTLSDNKYDQDYAFQFQALKDNQVLLSEFGNISRPTILDKFIVSYIYKDRGRYVLEDQVEVTRVEESVNESIPTNVTSFFLGNAPIVNVFNELLTSNGVAFRSAANSSQIPKEFSKELVFDSNRLPAKVGEYSINYETGEVFLVGSSIVGEGTGRNNYLASYYYRREFVNGLDFSIFGQDIVATPGRDLSGQDAEIFIRYEKTFTEGVDYLAKSHIEVMPEFVENRLSQSFRVKTLNAPITDVFRVLNQSTGEVYTPLYHTDTEIAFSGDRSPEIKEVVAEEASFKRVVDEELVVVGEFIIPAFNATITSSLSNNNITFHPGIPAELISKNSLDYFFREVDASGKQVGVTDINIRFFGQEDSNNLITSAGINSSSLPPSVGNSVIIGTRGFIVNLANEGIINNNHDSLGSLVNTSIELDNLDVFSREKYFRPIAKSNGVLNTNLGGLSRAIIDDKGSSFLENLSRLRKVGDYSVDYDHGVMYVSVSRDQGIALGAVKYFNRSILTRNKNIVTVSSISKKRNSPDPLTEAKEVYQFISNKNDEAEASDLESTLLEYDGEVTGLDPLGVRKPACIVLDDYTVVVPHKIKSINGIYNLNDLTGADLGSSSLSNRLEEFPSAELINSANNGGRNLFDVTSVSFQDNVIDFKKSKRRRVMTKGSSLSVTIIDDTASTFVEAKLASTGVHIFDKSLNITKLGNLEVAGVISNSNLATVSIASGPDLSVVDIDGTDYFLDANGNRFVITNIDTIMSSITVTTPAENNSLALAPVVDPLGVSEVIVKPTVTFLNNTMTIDIPLDSGLISGDLLEITYLTTLIPEVGTSLAIDYRFGFLFVDYAYLADQIVVWYEYGDNTIDWSISGAISEGDQYYVTYKFGALREALKANFGSLTGIPFFNSFGVNTDRELYRSAIKGTLQSFPKGPTIPAYKELIKSFTKISPEVDELTFGNWILGRDHLNPGKVSYSGVLKYAEGKFENGLIFDKDVKVSIPAVSSLSLDEGTLEAWVRPDWAGINNDATLTFSLNNLGTEKVVLMPNSDPFDSKNNWELIPSSNLVGGTDSSGQGVNIFNYRANPSSGLGLDKGIYGIYKRQDNLDQTISSNFSLEMRIGLFGENFNGLSSILAPPTLGALCEGETTSDLFFQNGPITMSSSPPSYNVGSVIITDSIRASGISFNLNEIPDFKFEVSYLGGISNIAGDNIPKYNKPHYTRGCTCTISNVIPELERFNNLSATVELQSPFDFSAFKSSINIIDDSPDVLILSDGDNNLYQVLGFYDDSNNFSSESIPNSATKFAVSRVGINNPSLLSSGSEAINSSLPSGVIRMLYKSADILTQGDYSNSILVHNFEKKHVVDWQKYHEYGVVRVPGENYVEISIDDVSAKMFYTDAFHSCNIDFANTISGTDIRGILIGALTDNLLTNLEVARGSGRLENRYSIQDVYIGQEGFNPVKNPFRLNRGDYPFSPVGEPREASTGEGIFIWFDELCNSPLSSEMGQWIFRAKSSRNMQYPVGVSLVDGNPTTIFKSFFPPYKFSGEVTTDGEFSSVSRAHREESMGGCDVGVVCNSTFRFCGNELLEDFGWSKIEDSDSDLINTIVGGREVQRGEWRRHGIFTTSTSTGIYRMGPSENNMMCSEENNFLGNLLFTENPCAGGDFEYIVSLRVAQIDLGINSGSSGKFSGIVSGNLTGITPIHINDGDVNVKVALAISASGEPLVLVIDVESQEILDIIPFLWNDQAFHEYRFQKDVVFGRLSLYVDDLLVSQILLSDFSTPLFDANSDFTNPNIALYLFDSQLVNPGVFHQENIPNIIDVDLIFFSGIRVGGDGYLEANDVLINTDSKIEFEFNIDNADGEPALIPVGQGYDGYDGYTYSQLIGVDEMFITSDRLRYLIDSGAGEGDKRFSIFKDGKGFLNFRIFDDSLKRGGESGFFNLATNIKHFSPGELHHIAASWKINSIDEKDEMHLFLDGQECPNIFKFGGKVPVRISDKFRDVSKEVLQDFLVADIDFCQKFKDGETSAGSPIFSSSTATFAQDMVGRSLIFTSSNNAPSLVGGEYIIKSVIDKNRVTLCRGYDLTLITFSASANDINFQFPPSAGIISPILTDLRNSRLSIIRTAQDGTKEEMSGVFYTIQNGETNIFRGTNVINPKFRANLDTRLIEFVGKDSLCNYTSTVAFSDIDVHIETYGLNLENCKYDLRLASSSYSSGDDIFSGKSVIRSRNSEPVALEDVKIRRTILPRTIIDILDPINLPGRGYQVDFNIPLSREGGIHNLSSESGAVSKQNQGRLLTLHFDSDNVDYCQFDGYVDGYQDGYLDGNVNTITIYGITTDGINEETFYIYKNGNLDGKKFFKRIDRISGSLLVIDPDYFEAALIDVKETNSVTVSDNGGSRAEVFEYKNGHLILSAAGSGGTFPFELHPGLYTIEYSTYLRVNLPSIGKELHIGSDFHGKNQFGGVVDDLRIISELSLDTRATEQVTSGTRSVTDDYNNTVQHCPDSQTLALIPFNNPIELQSRRLRNSEFLDPTTNIKYTLTTAKIADLLTVINDKEMFMSKMLNYGFTLGEAETVFYEAHRAGGGPIFNDADFYRNVEEFPKSDNSVNSSFGKSGNFTSGRGLVFLNNDNKFRRGEGTIEFWVSPAIDTFVDKEKRYYVDIYSAKRERLKSKTTTSIELPNSAGEIISIKLMKRTNGFSNFYDSSEASTILFDEVSRSQISGVLEGGTGTEKDFGVGSRLSSDGRRVILSEALPGEHIDVIVTYIPLSSHGDRFSIFKNEFNQLVFGITAAGVDNVVTIDIDWKKNSWHKVMCIYRTGTSFDTMRIFADGKEGGFIRYGTGIIYGTGYIYGQYIQRDGQFRNQEFTIPLGDEFRLVALGSDVFGDSNSRSRMDNVRFSRVMRGVVNDAGGNSIDLGYSSNLNTVAPVVEDDVTTLIVNFDAIIEKIDKFATVINSKNGIYNFDISVHDNFDKVIGVNNGEVEDLIVELVNRLKPAHTNALVRFKKNRC